MNLVAMNKDQQTHADRQHHGGNPELNVSQNGPQHVTAATTFALHADPRLVPEITLPFTKIYVIGRTVPLSRKTAQALTTFPGQNILGKGHCPAAETGVR
jgi:hypothetical protein